jgi:hypothetical protein
MKMFKVIALVALSFGFTAQSAMAELGRATSTEDVVAGSFLCETSGKLVKHRLADARGARNADATHHEQGNTSGSVRSGL